MAGLRYLSGVTTLSLDAEKCGGCAVCTQVCPHGVLSMAGRKVQISDRDACMECGACARNCATEALTVKPGVGCAYGIIKGYLLGTEPDCGCSSDPYCC